MTVVDEQVAGVNSQPSEVVSNFLAEAIAKDDYGDASLYQYFVMSLEDIYEESLDDQEPNTASDKEVFDWGAYISDLEAVIWGLLNQRALLVNVLHRIQDAQYNRDPKDPFSVLGLETLKKMILYCVTGRDYALSDHAGKFYQTEQFEAACNLHPLLPPEWQPRAAKFIEIYASKYFGTEFATATHRT